MTAKEYLQQAYKIKRTMRVRQEQIAALRATATDVSVHTDSVRVSGTGNRDSRMRVVDKLVDLQKRLEREARHLVEKYTEIESTINAVENDTYRELLTLRYLAFMRWEGIAAVMELDLRWVYRLHEKALQAVDH